MTIKTILKLGAASAVLGSSISHSAYAQSTSNDGEEDAVARLGAITVTAQRVEENLQDVPVAVTALDQSLIEERQVADVLDLQSSVPNINLATNTGTASAARIFLRGVGEDESRGAVDQAVGIYVDGVYIGRSVGSLFDVVDLAGIEVLRGPQGTLYGRNTIGGAIKLTSVRPQFENGGSFSTVVGNNGRIDLRGTGNLQLGDRTAFRLTGLLRERDGFHEINPNGGLAGQQRDDVGALHTLSFRASLLHEFSDDWSVYLTYDQTLDRSDPIPDSAAPPNDADNNIFTIEPVPGATCAAVDTQLGCFTAYDQRLEARGVSAEVTGRFGDLDFTSITGYRELEDDLTTRIGLPYQQQTDQDQFSQEVTLSKSGDGPLDWVVGAYYFTEDLTLDTVFAFPFVNETSTDSVALFGQASYDVTDALSLTGGVRYTDESKDFFGANLLDVPPFNTFTRTDSADFENVSFTVGADYRFTQSVLGYAKYATGFKSGGWSPDAFGATAVFLPVEEETLDSVEAGLKTDLFDNRLRVNTAVFFNQYEGLQIGATVPGLGFTRFNVDETEIMGLEVEATWQVTEALQFFGNLGLLDAEYSSVTGDQARGLTNNGAGCPAGVDPTVDSEIIDCALGLDLKNAPEYKATVGTLYTTRVDAGDITISADATFEDETWALVANSPPHARIEVDPIYNARIKYQADTGWYLALWGKNLADQEYYRAASASSFTAYASDPRTYGVEIGMDF